MCGRHETSNNEQQWATNATRFSPPPLLRRQDNFISFIDVHLRSAERVSRTVVLNGRKRIRFLRSDLHDCCSLLQLVLHHDLSTSSTDHSRAWRAHEWFVKIPLKGSHACDFLLLFIIATSPCLIRFNRDKTSWLRDAVILGGSFLKIRAVTMKLVTTNNHESPMQSGFRLLRWCAAKTTSTHSSTCIYDWESRSSEPSSQRSNTGRENKIFGKWSLRLLAWFFN
jgi:hypothetical protein